MTFISYANARHKKQVRALRLPDRKFRDIAWTEAERHRALVAAGDESASQCWARFKPDVPPGTDASLAINVNALSAVLS